MSKRFNAAIAARASCQHGLVTRRQLLVIGLTERTIDCRIESGSLQVVHPSVYRIAGAPRCWEQDLLAAHLAAGDASAVSHLGAATLYDYEGIAADKPYILVMHSRRLDLEGVSVRRTRVLNRQDVVRRGALRLTSPARTLIDIAGLVRPLSLEIALDDGLRRRIVTLDRLRRTLDARGPNGVRGWRAIDRLVTERQGTAPTGSGKETMFRRGLVRRGLPLPVKQFVVRDDDNRFVARVDFAYPDIRLAIEVDGSQHASLRQWRADMLRQNKLTLAHWRFLRFPRTDRRGQLEAFETIEAALVSLGTATDTRGR